MKVAIYKWTEGQTEKLVNEAEGDSLLRVMLQCFVPLYVTNWVHVSEGRVEKIVDGKVVSYYRAVVAV